MIASVTPSPSTSRSSLTAQPNRAPLPVVGPWKVRSTCTGCTKLPDAPAAAVNVARTTAAMAAARVKTRDIDPSSVGLGAMLRTPRSGDIGRSCGPRSGGQKASDQAGQRRPVGRGRPYRGRRLAERAPEPRREVAVTLEAELERDVPHRHPAQQRAERPPQP